MIEWKMPSLYKGIDANTAKEEVDKVNANPEKLWRSQVENTAPLHSVFEWDNGKAADEWRTQQARVMIGNLVTVQVGNVTLSKPVRVFLRTSESIRGEYTSIEVLTSTEIGREQMLKKALGELQAFREKYTLLNELSGLFNEINSIEKIIKEGNK